MDTFERLAHRHTDAVYRQMVRVYGNREDVLIEAMLKASAISTNCAIR